MELAKEGYFDHKRIVKVIFTDDPKEAAKLALKIGGERSEARDI